ncbi:hypothetical protein AVEN_109860-1 [Araneus ventricosus]|uniref:Uncharacterized protein n=1 Tax=Araneus ventricosus TaxID=182803 RepID=A0A4Y2PM54_ARAVE|nr:hypothetical protein AVEN_109860-1 [Araneus ventricosus]
MFTPKFSLPPVSQLESQLQEYYALHGQENPSSSLQATVLFPAISVDSSLTIQIPAHAGKRSSPLLNFLSLDVTLSCAENTQLWWKSVLSNKLSRKNIAKLASFLTENENIIKQPPGATNSSYTNTDFSPSPKPQIYGVRPSRGLIPRTLISRPTSIL